MINDFLFCKNFRYGFKIKSPIILKIFRIFRKKFYREYYIRINLQVFPIRIRGSRHTELFFMEYVPLGGHPDDIQTHSSTSPPPMGSVSFYSASNVRGRYDFPLLKLSTEVLIFAQYKLFTNHTRHISFLSKIHTFQFLLPM